MSNVEMAVIFLVGVIIGAVIWNVFFMPRFVEWMWENHKND